MIPESNIWLFSVLTQPLPTTSRLPTTLHPYMIACGIGYTNKNAMKNGGQFRTVDI